MLLLERSADVNTQDRLQGRGTRPPDARRRKGRSRLERQRRSDAAVMGGMETARRRGASAVQQRKVEADLNDNA